MGPGTGASAHNSLHPRSCSTTNSKSPPTAAYQTECDFLLNLGWTSTDLLADRSEHPGNSPTQAATPTSSMYLP